MYETLTLPHEGLKWFLCGKNIPLIIWKRILIKYKVTIIIKTISTYLDNKYHAICKCPFQKPKMLAFTAIEQFQAHSSQLNNPKTKCAIGCLPKAYIDDWGFDIFEVKFIWIQLT